MPTSAALDNGCLAVFLKSQYNYCPAAAVIVDAVCVQVRSGLRHGGFVRAVEAWWGPAPVVGGAPLPDNYDGPLRAVKLTFSDKTEPVVSLLAGQWAADCVALM